MKALTNNEKLAKYLELDNEIKRLTKERDEIKEWVKGQGTFSTMDYVASVTSQIRRSLKGLSDVAAVYTEADLEKHGLINIAEFNIVKVSKKEGK